MLSSYQEIGFRHKKLPLRRERRLIALAQRGKSAAQERLLLHLVGFICFRIKTTLGSKQLKRFGDDIFQDCLVLAMKNIKNFDLKYRDSRGKRQRLHLSTYMWKGVTGIMFSWVKKRKEVCSADLPEWKGRALWN